ncbi:unnamed protein product [Lupinus luteus]|uniref:Serine aminopeptidase S33 domain-containing protein n=1 Tax=Lupinus luteus TaxID=3873 RepID=A0AAV1X586_LUPLU
MEHETEIKYEEEFISNSRGMKLLASRWLPQNESPKALVFMCHGYSLECSITMNSTATRLAKAGYAVYGVDYEGHGKSEGLQGESMGGAVAILLHWKKPDYWDGAILAAPMCKIGDDMSPNAVMVSILTGLSKVAPKWKLVPTEDLIEIGFKVPEVREQIRANPYCYKGKPRLKTAHELLRISTEIQQRLHEVCQSFNIVFNAKNPLKNIVFNAKNPLKLITLNEFDAKVKTLL